MPSSFTGADIRTLRKLLGVTQADMGRLLGYAPSTVRDWERNRRSVPMAVNRKVILLARRAEKQQRAAMRFLSGLR